MKVSERGVLKCRQCDARRDSAHFRRVSPREITSAKSLARASLDARFTRALDRMWIAFQPIVSWEERRVVGYEALLRSEEPTLQNPSELLATAERLGRLHELGRAIRGRVASEAVGAPRGVQIFVNLHAADLNDDQLYIAGSAFANIAERVVLEITERASRGVVRARHARRARMRSSSGLSLRATRARFSRAALVTRSRLRCHARPRAAR